MSTQRQGLVYGLAAYGLWGLFPLYWPLLRRHPRDATGPLATGRLPDPPGVAAGEQVLQFGRTGARLRGFDLVAHQVVVHRPVDGPTPLGIFPSVDRPVYDDLMRDPIEPAQ